MEVFSSDSERGERPVAESPVSYRIRWGNVLLALAALGAILAALALPRGGSAPHYAPPAEAAIGATVPADPTADVAKPRRHRHRKARRRQKRRTAKRSARRSGTTPAPRAPTRQPAPASSPAPAPPASDIPAADREFGP